MLFGCAESMPDREIDGKKSPQVAVTKVSVGPMPVEYTLPARVAPLRIAEVRPQVSGILEKRLFKEGAFVNAGDLLYIINSDDYQIQVARARAEVMAAKAELETLKNEASRLKKLSEDDAISRQLSERAQAEYLQGLARVQVAEAALNQAELDLKRTEIRAPIAGVISRAWITEGALVAADQNQPLASIQQLDPIYIDIVQSGEQMLLVQQKLASGWMKPGNREVELIIGDQVYPHTGQIKATERNIDLQTGVLTLRAEIPNPDGLLLPGMFVRARVQLGVARAVALVPQQAVHFNGRGEAQVWVVGDDQSVSLRRVELLASKEHQWVLGEGLAEGERVLVEGSLRVYPGLVVDAVPWTNTGEASERTALVRVENATEAQP
ncbi:efflux RND transporter periplasmic adaptor subunit [Microbulbifer thermotolerans]|uniref:efflux RND transporter periplasmic adaptor subunit n=2 Tax=Microbulbifer thermotolerans TaxID=252514 RepID=UPI000944D9D8